MTCPSDCWERVEPRCDPGWQLLWRTRGLSNAACNYISNTDLCINVEFQNIFIALYWLLETFHVNIFDMWIWLSSAEEQTHTRGPHRLFQRKPPVQLSRECCSSSRPADVTVYPRQAAVHAGAMRRWDLLNAALRGREGKRLSTAAAEGFPVNWLLNTSSVLLLAAEGWNLQARSGGAVWFFFDVPQLWQTSPPRVMRIIIMSFILF